MFHVKHRHKSRKNGTKTRSDPVFVLNIAKKSRVVAAFCLELALLMQSLVSIREYAKRRPVSDRVVFDAF